MVNPLVPYELGIEVCQGGESKKPPDIEKEGERIRVFILLLLLFFFTL